MGEHTGKSFKKIWKVRTTHFFYHSSLHRSSFMFIFPHSFFLQIKDLCNYNDVKLAVVSDEKLSSDAELKIAIASNFPLEVTLKRKSFYILFTNAEERVSLIDDCLFPPPSSYLLIFLSSHFLFSFFLFPSRVLGFLNSKLLLNFNRTIPK
jgi:hypothetical protein